jgi:outer membrane receptor protein involved in Fe transport
MVGRLVFVGFGGYAVAAYPQVSPSSSGPRELEEVIVTATRQTTTALDVPMSILAITQDAMDERGIRTASDLSRVVPGLRISQYGTNDAVQTISIRGVQSGGAATTGIYLDETPLAKRTDLVAGGSSPMPQLFDLERVEVLRGPQGTLYGAGSQGGTVRFISPQPSLTESERFVRGELSDMSEGEPGYRVGVGFGGPIKDDVLGYRASVMARSTGGWLDYVWRLNGETVAEDTNRVDSGVVRLALAYAPNESLLITPTLHYQKQHAYDQDRYWEPVARSTAPARPANPATSYGPYDFYGPYKSGDTCNIGDNFVDTVEPCVPKQPERSDLGIASLTFDYDAFANVALKGVVSYAYDQTEHNTDFSYQVPQNFQAGNPFVARLPFFQSLPRVENKRDSGSAELRFSSTDPDARLSWVGGFFYSHTNNRGYSWNEANEFNDLTLAIFGLTVQQFFGVPMYNGNQSFNRFLRLIDDEVALYGEVDYALTEKLRLLAGLRVSQTQFDYYQTAVGPIVRLSVATVENGGIVQGQVEETPVSPKIGLQYEFSDRGQVYGTLSNGYRVGGINPIPPRGQCDGDLAFLGISSTPTEFDSDTVWNLEIGTKLGGPRVQFATSLFRLEWEDTQTRFGLPTCGFGYNVNAGKAESQGLDLEVTASLGPVITSFAVGYTDAEYVEGVVGPPPTNTVFIQPGDPLPIPDWTYNLGIRYDFNPGGRPAFIRADWQHTEDFQQGVNFGSAGYNPENRDIEDADFVSLRAGLVFNRTQVELFVDNATDSQDALSRNGGRSGCNVTSGPACTVYQSYNPVFRTLTYRPRTVGVAVDYSF